MKPGLFNLFPNENYLDLRPYQSGYADNEPKSFYGPATRNHYLFHYVISGAGTLVADDENGIERSFYIHSGQGFQIFPGQVTTYWADRNHPWEYVWIGFDGVYAPKVLNMAGLTYQTPIYRSKDKTLTARLMDAMMEMAKPLSETSFYKISQLYLFSDLLIRSSATEKNTSLGGSMSEYYLQTAFSYIESNFMNAISVESIAEFCNIHRNQLLKVFKSSIGKSPQEYLITYRMSKASQLLLTTNLSINEIGNAIGYTNQLNFSRAFKNVYGTSPKQYRKENRKDEEKENKK